MDDAVHHVRYDNVEVIDLTGNSDNSVSGDERDICCLAVTPPTTGLLDSRESTTITNIVNSFCFSRSETRMHTGTEIRICPYGIFSTKRSRMSSMDLQQE